MSEVGVHKICDPKSAVTCDKMIGITVPEDLSSSDNKKSNTFGKDIYITVEDEIIATNEKDHIITPTVALDSSTLDVLHNQALTDSDTTDTNDKTNTIHIDNILSTDVLSDLKSEESKRKSVDSKENDTKVGTVVINPSKTKTEKISDDELLPQKYAVDEIGLSKDGSDVTGRNNIGYIELCSTCEAVGVHTTCVQMDPENESEKDTRAQDRENNNTADACTDGSKTPPGVDVSAGRENDSMAYRTHSVDGSPKQNLMHRQGPGALAEPDQSNGRERIFASVSSLLCVVFYTFLFGIIACIESTSCSRSRIYFAIPVSIIYVIYLTESLMDKTTRNYLRNPMSFKQFGCLVHKWRTTNPKAMITVRLLPGWHVSGKTVEELEKNRKISATMIYRKCVDHSDDIVQMATHKRYKVLVQRTFTCADTITRKNLEREIDGFKKYCGFNDKGMECIRELELDGFQKRLLVYEDKMPWYLSTCVYWLSLVFALNGPLRVWIYFRFSETFNYNVIKAVSVQRQ